MQEHKNYQDSDSAELTITQKGTSLYIDRPNDKQIKIPSQLYPLPGINGPLCIHSGNTEPFEYGKQTEKIKAIFNSMKPGIGTCYQNVNYPRPKGHG